MNKIIISVLVTLLSALATVNAQSEDCAGIVSGQVLDMDGNPIEDAYVFLLDDISTQNIMASDYSDSDGLFSLSCQCGERVLGISRLGFNMATYEVTIEDGVTLNKGECRLEGNSQELQTVVVKGRPMRINILPDGFSVNVKEIAKSSNNALDLLGRLPQIKVKGNDLKVMGKEKILLRVNNVLQRVSAEQLPNVLRGYDASLINSVDVITSPAVKYDPDGSTAMIILHMYSRFNKYAGGNIGTELMKGSGYDGRYGVYGSMVFNNNRWFVDITPSYNHNYSHSSEYSRHQYDTGEIYIDNNPSRGHSNFLGAYATLQYQYHKNGVVGLNCNLSRRVTDNDFISEEIYTEQKTFNRNSFDISRPRINASLYAEQAFSEAFKAWLETTFFNYSEKTNQLFDGCDASDSSPFMSYLSNQKLKSAGMTFSNDYSISLGEAARFNLDFGLKGYYARIDNYRDNELHDSELSAAKQVDNLVLDETRLNPYVSATYRPMPAFYFRLGAQLSYTHRQFHSRDIDTHSLNYTSWLPDFIANWTPSEGSRFSFSLTSGIVEPKFDQINPFEWRTNLYSYFRGNLNLKSESRYYYKAVYTYRGNLSVTAYINQMRNQMSAIGKVIDGNMYYTTRNAQNSVAYGIKPSYYYDNLSWLDLSAEIYWGYGISKGIIPEILKKVTSNLWGGNIYAGFIFNRSRTLTGYIDLDYTGPQRTSLSRIKAMFDCGAGISWSLLKRKMNISLSGINLFASRYKGSSIREGYSTVFKNRYNYPTLYLSVTYKFNNLKDPTPGRQKMIRNVEQRM
ncbi:MAG: TonB-dependent receptor family protein [Muribaculaceae bacterium]|nr:TonB-dependent receptor family protein [Muribaculaceae bacterium]